MVIGDHGAHIQNVQQHALMEPKQDHENVTTLLRLIMATNVKERKSKHLHALWIIAQVNKL